MKLNKTLLITAVFSLSSCALFGPSVSGETVADSVLQSDIMRTLNLFSQATNDCAIERAIASVEKVNTNNQGQIKSVDENWLVKDCKGERNVPIKLTVDPNGGTFYNIRFNGNK